MTATATAVDCLCRGTGIIIDHDSIETPPAIRACVAHPLPGVHPVPAAGDLLLIEHGTPDGIERTNRHLAAARLDAILNAAALGPEGLRTVVMLAKYTTRTCKFCGQVVTSKNASVDYCEACHYEGRALEAVHVVLFEQLRALPGVQEAGIAHTGGNCFNLYVTAADERYLVATVDGVPRVPQEGERWGYVALWKNAESAIDADPRALISSHEGGAWTDEQLLGIVRDLLG